MRKRLLAALLALMMLVSLLPMTVLAEGDGDVMPTPTPAQEMANATPTPTAEVTPTPTPTAEVTPTPASTAEVTPTPTPTAEVTPTPTPTAEVTPTPTPTAEVTPTPASTAEVTPTPAPTAEVTPTPAPTAEVTPTPTPTAEVTPTPVPTVEVTPTPIPDKGPILKAPAPKTTETAKLYAVKDGNVMTELYVSASDGLFVNLYYGDPADGYENDIAVTNAEIKGEASVYKPDETGNGYQINPSASKMNAAYLEYKVDESTTATLTVHSVSKLCAVLKGSGDVVDSLSLNVGNPVEVQLLYMGIPVHTSDKLAWPSGCSMEYADGYWTITMKNYQPNATIGYDGEWMNLNITWDANDMLLYVVEVGETVAEVNPVVTSDGLIVDLYYGTPDGVTTDDEVITDSTLFTCGGNISCTKTEDGHWKLQIDDSAADAWGTIYYQVDTNERAELPIQVKKATETPAFYLMYNESMFFDDYRNIPVGDDGIYAELYFTDQYGDKIKLTDQSGVTSSGVDAFEYVAEGDNAGKWHIAMTEAGKEGTITYKVGETSYNLVVEAVSSGGNSGGMQSDGIVVNFPVNGVDVPITVGFGVIQQETMFVGVTHIGDSYTDESDYDFYHEFALAALSNKGTNAEAVAPAEFFACISDVEFSLGNCVDADGNTQAPFNCTLSETVAHPFAGINTWSATITAPVKQGFDAEVFLGFTLTLPGEEPVEYVLRANVFYHEITKLTIEATKEEIPDAATLNQILSSYDNLMNWAVQNRNNDWQNWHKGGRTGDVSLILPAVTYTEVIVCATENHDPDGNNMIHSGIGLYGSREESGAQTTMPGLVANGGLACVRHIVFDGKMSSANGTGIKVNGGEGFAQDDLVDVGYNTFLNLDCGIHSTSGGWAGGILENVFRDCKQGILIDCEGDEGGSGNCDFGWNQFRNCKNAAVVINGLPNGVTPYSLRIHDSIFVDNAQDFRLDGKAEPGIYYFYLNYYGKSNGNNKNEARTVILGNKANATLVTNPCFADEDMTKVKVDNSDGLSAWILENMANELIIDGEMLKQNTGVTEISLLDENENETARWTFGGEGE